MVYSVKQAADLAGVTVQAVYQRIGKLNENERAVFISIDEKGNKLLSDTFVNSLKGKAAAMEQEQREQLQALQDIIDQQAAEIKKLSADLQTLEINKAADLIQAKEQGRAEERERLNKDIDDLKEEKARLYTEIDTLHNQINNLIQLNGNNQLLLLQAAGTPDKKKKGGFLSLFGKKNKAANTEGADE